MGDWYRKKTWTTADKEHFFEKLVRARKDGRAQYLKIQAIELVATKDQHLLNIAETLLHQLLEDYPEDRFNRPGALVTFALIYQLRDDLDTAIEYYKQALDFELVYPQVKTNAYLDYAELIIKTQKTEYYAEVEQLLLARVPGNLFPIVQYKGYSMLSIINRHKGDMPQAVHFASLAEKYANQQTTEMRYHKYLGVVKERDSWLDRLVKK